MTCAVVHKLSEFTGVSLEIGDKKTWAKMGKRPIVLGFSPYHLSKKKLWMLKFFEGTWHCKFCGSKVESIFDRRSGFLLSNILKFNFWIILSIRNLTVNTRLGSKLLILRTIMSLIFYAAILVLSNATSTERTIVQLLNSLSLWILFEIGVIRTSMSLKNFKYSSREFQHSSFYVISAGFLTTLIDLTIVILFIGVYAITLGNLPVMAVILNCIRLFSAYLIMLPQAFVFSYIVAYFNRNSVDLKHFLPWLLRLILFTTPLFRHNLLTQFNLLNFLLEISPLALPFNFIVKDARFGTSDVLSYFGYGFGVLIFIFLIYNRKTI